MQIPPIPSWDAIHPLVIHFPIVLLLLTPLFIVIAAALRPPRNVPYMVAALIVLLLGTGSLFAAASSGEEAAELAERGGAMESVLNAHEHLATRTEITFSVLSLLFLGLFLWPRIAKRAETRITSTVLPLGFLALYLVGTASLVHTAHAGGRLVHEFGVHAIMPSQSGEVTNSPSKPNASQKEDSD